MGESAVMIRSYTHPSDGSREGTEVDPIRALTESISFGRFMSESLAWEKWSSFSHNRHLEEAEKFSKPGSVAEKKAYFEAHYKKIAAAKKASALTEQANVVTGNNVEEFNMPNEAGNISSLDSKSTKTDANVELKDGNIEKEESGIEDHGIIENITYGENRDVIVDKIVPTQEEMVPVKEAVTQEILVQIRKRKHEISTSSSSVSITKSKLPLLAKQTTPVHLKKGITTNSNSKTIDRDPIRSKSKFPKSLHMSINSESLDQITKTKQEISSTKSSVSIIKPKVPFSAKLTTPAQPRKEVKATSNNNKNVSGYFNDNKSLHISMNEESFASRRNTKQGTPSSKSSTKLPLPAKVTSSVQSRKEITATSSSKKIERESVDKKRNFPKSLHMSINLSSHDSVTPASETRRSRTPINYSKAETGRADRNCSSTLSMEDTKSSTRCQSKPRATTVSSPFSFLSEERAKKRKEFYQKIEDKKNAANPEKVQIQINAKVKAENGPNNLRQRFVACTKRATDSNNYQTSSPSKPMKIPPMRSQSPKHVQKPTPAGISQDTNYGPRRRPPVMIVGSSHTTAKINQSLSRSITSLPKKKIHENASPNILLSI